MTTWTAKVGLRRPGTLAWAVSQIRPASEWMPAIPCESLCVCSDCDERDRQQRAEYENNWNPGWLRDQVTRGAAMLDGLPSEMVETLAHRTAVRAAQARVASIPASHRAYLENEFQRAEADARAILRAKGPTQ